MADCVALFVEPVQPNSQETPSLKTTPDQFDDLRKIARKHRFDLASLELSKRATTCRLIVEKGKQRKMERDLQASRERVRVGECSLAKTERLITEAKRHVTEWNSQVDELHKDKGIQRK
ncbi:hypothetical protein KIPB_004298 [Kipferlia bialata]|uniref:Uncharacterized protein n=1 Tax=Kipferlia bialata TaxID=797122 RepID=A0A391NL50_9EUKA|nr:hypothetical protein KIPB_004298 [Kipferlia bialata]|eukprot:g4298.t1